MNRPDMALMSFELFDFIMNSEDDVVIDISKIHDVHPDMIAAIGHIFKFLVSKNRRLSLRGAHFNAIETLKKHDLMMLVLKENKMKKIQNSYKISRFIQSYRRSEL